jgi:hypothetical protein
MIKIKLLKNEKKKPKRIQLQVAKNSDDEQNAAEEESFSQVVSHSFGI